MDITTIIEAVFTVIAATVTCLLIPWLRKRSSMEQQDTVMMWVRIAVEAAEQIFAGAGRGAEKKAYVTAFLQKRGLYMDMDRIEAMIESAVWRMINGE